MQKEKMEVKAYSLDRSHIEHVSEEAWQKRISESAYVRELIERDIQNKKRKK